MGNIGLNGLRDAFAWLVHREYVPAICETCGDFPEHLGIAYVTHGGRPECETYPDFGLDDVLDALERSR